MYYENRYGKRIVKANKVVTTTTNPEEAVATTDPNEAETTLS